MVGTTSSYNRSLRVLVAVASYGTSNDCYLLRLIQEYRAMEFKVDIVVLSNLCKQPAPEIEVLVGLPDRGNPWSLPFAHKQIFADRIEEYDLFVYSEDDILITETNLCSFLKVSEYLQEDEIAGFLRVEKGLKGNITYPDAHGNFHWSPSSLRSRGGYTLAHFTNEHAACYVLTRSQLRKALQSGGFLTPPHEWKYDLLCTAATDPYTNCGFTKLIPISNVCDFTVHHLTNKYSGSVGVEDSEFEAQIDKLLALHENTCPPTPLLCATETKLWRAMYSKDYYEPVCKEVVSLIPPTARNILSIGCGSGETELWLAQRGFKVTALPLDPIICSSAARRGVEILLTEFRTASEILKGRQFDCLLCLNILHLTRDPTDMLSSLLKNLRTDCPVIIQTPNMLCLPTILDRIRNPLRYRGLGSYDISGVHFSSVNKVRAWCYNAGLKVESTMRVTVNDYWEMSRRPRTILRDYLVRFAGTSLSPGVVCLARKQELSEQEAPKHKVGYRGAAMVEVPAKPQSTHLYHAASERISNAPSASPMQASEV